MSLQKNIHNLLLFLSCFIFLVSCKKDAGEGTKTSSNGGTESHDVGEACMRCHDNGGSNEYWFTVAGTVYKPDSVSLNPNGTVYLYSDSTHNNLVVSIPVDGKANFFTTSGISFGSGLYTAVKSLSGQILFMNGAILNGNCNGCHTSGNRIIVN